MQRQGPYRKEDIHTHICTYAHTVGLPYLLVLHSQIEPTMDQKYEKKFNKVLKDNIWICQVLATIHISFTLYSVQFNSVAQLCPTLQSHEWQHTRPPVHHQLPEFTQTHVHQVGDAIQPSHPLSSPFPPAPNPSQHQSLFQLVNSSHEVATVLEFQL